MSNESDDLVITALALSDDGETGVLASGDQGQLGMFELGSMNSFRALDMQHGRPVTAIALTPTNIITMCAGGTIGVWDRLTDRGGAVFGEPSLTWCRCAISEDGRRAVALDEEGAVTLWDVPGRKVTALPVSAEGSGWDCIAMSANGRWVLVGAGKTFSLWDADNNQLTRRDTTESFLGDEFAVSIDGGHAIRGSPLGEVAVANLSDSGEEQRLGAHVRDVCIVIAIGDGRRALTCSLDHTAKVWDLDISAQTDTTEEAHVRFLTAAAVAPDVRLALIGAEFKPLMLWDLGSGRALRPLGEHYMVNALAITSDGIRAVSGSGDGTVKVWDMEHEAQLYCFGTPFEDDQVFKVAITPDGSFAAAASERFTSVWDLASGDRIAHLPNDDGNPRAIALTPDGRRVLTGAEGGVIRVYDVRTADLLKYDHNNINLDGWTFARVDALCLTANGEMVLSAGMDQMLKLREVATGQGVSAILTCPENDWTPLSGNRFVRSLAFSNDDTFAAAAWDGQRVRMWDMRTCREVAAAVIASYEFAAVGGSTPAVLAGSADHLAYYEIVIPPGYEQVLLDVPLDYPGTVLDPLATQIVQLLSDESSIASSTELTYLINEIWASNAILGAALIRLRAGDRTARLFRGLDATGMLLIRKLLASIKD